MGYKCPVCHYDGLYTPAYTEKGNPSDEICPCCGFQFGLDDYPNKEECQEKWRKKWIEDGSKWWADECPVDWNPQKQLESLKKL